MEVLALKAVQFWHGPPGLPGTCGGGLAERNLGPFLVVRNSETCSMLLSGRF